MYQTFQGTMATYYCKWIIGDTDIIGNVNTACYGITIVATLLLGKSNASYIEKETGVSLSVIYYCRFLIIDLKSNKCSAL